MLRYFARQVPQCVGSALQLLPFPSERHHDQQPGNKSSELEVPDIPRGKFLNASARRSNCFPFRPNGVAIGN